MNFQHATRRAVALVILATAFVAIAAPAAQADRGHHRYKPGPAHVVYAPPVYHTGYAPAPRVYVHSSSGAEVFAGFLGGLIIGAAVAHAVPAPDYYYYDPYCHERFVSLDAYHQHVWHHSHPSVIRVIETGSGDCAYSYRLDQGEWRRCGSDGAYYASGYGNHWDR